jgi:hypothetical protein
MKKTVLALALVLSTSVLSQKKLTFNVPSMAKPAVEYRTGPWMMFGGLVFDLAGLLTYRTMQGGSTSQQAKAIYQPYLLPVISGNAVLSVGIVYTIKGR